MMKIPNPQAAQSRCRRIVGLATVVACLAVAPLTHAADTKQAALDKALDAAMTPGEGQKRLQPMIGNFDVKISTWVHPTKPPVVTSGSAVSSWVLGNRYVQTMLSSGDMDTAFNGIGYVAYDNVAKLYQAAWMDNGSTGMTWYSGRLDASGKSAVMKATTTDPITGKPSPLELRLSISPDGSHVSELWGMGLGTTMFKMMELRYTPAGK